MTKFNATDSTLGFEMHDTGFVLWIGVLAFGTNGRLYCDADSKGGAPSVHFATLSSKPSLTYDDFAIV
jgi:hypothetical protein